MTGLLSTGSSALLAFQRALNTVGHNVANAATPGYSRQRVELAARPGQNISGVGFTGSGVEVDRLQRLADGLVFARQVDSSGEVGRLTQLSAMSTRVDALVSDPATGLSSPWSSFFAATQDVASDPTSTVARSQMLARGEQLVARWRSMDGEFDRIEGEVDQRIAGHAASANQLAREIAEINQTIAAAGSNVSNDLLDQRDLRVDKLAALVGATTVEQDDGSLNVFTGGGQPMVLGARAMTLQTVSDPYRPGRMQLSLDGGGASQVILPAQSVGGEIGGLLEFRTRVLDPSRAELGRLATAFAMGMNAQQRAGVDYTGAPGTDMFALAPPATSAHALNTGTATFAARVGDVGALKGDDLHLSFNGGAWSAVRAGTGEAVPITGTGTAADPLRMDGVELVVAGAPANGDRFSLRPTSEAAGALRQVMTDPAKVAAANPLQASIDATNLGTGATRNPRVTDPAAFAGFSGAAIEFIDAASYTVNGAGPYPYTPGSPLTGPGWSVDLTGTPAAGDNFALAATPPRSADNGNARLLAGMDSKGLLAGGTLGLTQGLAQFTARAGSDARHAELSLEAQAAIHAQISAERESASGVNLDEEAADLMRFQQAYQAAAQVIGTADTLFQTLLGAVRR